MSRYAIKFSKQGYIKYTSHLDLLRLFKRIIKRSDIKLKYSQGFNPHPKIGFAQPLSLGYESHYEFLEIETAVRYTTEDIVGRLNSRMPEGILINECIELAETGKSLASAVYEAEYLVMIPVKENIDVEKAVCEYLSQDEIHAMKRQKKTKQFKEIDIKGMIRSVDATMQDGYIFMNLKCDCGSDSNLSPELVISSFLEFTGITTIRAEIEVMRKTMKMKGYRL